MESKLYWNFDIFNRWHYKIFKIFPDSNDLNMVLRIIIFDCALSSYLLKKVSCRAPNFDSSSTVFDISLIKFSIINWWGNSLRSKDNNFKIFPVLANATLSYADNAYNICTAPWQSILISICRNNSRRTNYWSKMATSNIIQKSLLSPSKLFFYLSTILMAVTLIVSLRSKAISKKPMIGPPIKVWIKIEPV